jgi:hypothetical protein
MDYTDYIGKRRPGLEDRCRSNLGICSPFFRTIGLIQLRLPVSPLEARPNNSQESFSLGDPGDDSVTPRRLQTTRRIPRRRAEILAGRSTRAPAPSITKGDRGSLVRTQFVEPDRVTSPENP